MTDKKKQIEELARYCCLSCEKEYCGRCIEGFDPGRCTAALDTAEAIHNAGYRKQSGWINVEERFPDEVGLHLVWNKEQNAPEIKFFFQLPPDYPVETYPDIREYFGNVADHKKFSHWMPLPEPPQMKGSA